MIASCLWHGRYNINVSSAADMEVYAGRYDTEIISFYDEQGLLLPAKVDDFTGYR